MANEKRNINIFFSKNIFIGSFNLPKDMPKVQLPEICFVGRSNVGKSSIINKITNSKKLAKTSKTPGRTQSINFFEINKKINIIDLPGYGYAKFSKKMREDLNNLVESYIIDRKNLIKIFILIDCRIGIKNSDINFFDLLNSYNKKFSVIITKTDKCSEILIEKMIKSVETLMKNYQKNYLGFFVSSVKKNIGVLDIQKDIFNLSKYHEI